MAASDYPKGSILNPYSIIEYWDMRDVYNNWFGGWVKPNPDEITYYSANHTAYGNMGARNNPYPYAIFNELSQNGMWVGGWVQTENDTMYNNIYPNVGDTQETAASMDIYVEMSILGIWFGGWVSMDEGIRYVADPSTIINNDEGSGSEDEGCGCEDEGCGCGCESGCGEEEEEEEDDGSSLDSDFYFKIKKNSKTHNLLTPFGITIPIKVKWSTGYFNSRTHECTSKIKVSLNSAITSSNSDYTYVDNTFSASGIWVTPMMMLLTISIQFRDQNGNISSYSSDLQVDGNDAGSE